MMILQQGAYILYYLSKSVSQIKKEGMLELLINSLSYSTPVVLALLECSIPAISSVLFYTEIFLAIHPKLCPSLVYMKLMYRARLAGLNGKDSFGVWTWESVLPETIGVLISIVVFPALTLMNEGICKRK